jgi:hypothetical protein
MCNGCFLKPNKNVYFYLTNCGHIFCENCVNSSKFTIPTQFEIQSSIFHFLLASLHFEETSEVCYVCGTKCTTNQLTARVCHFSFNFFMSMWLLCLSISCFFFVHLLDETRVASLLHRHSSFAV